MVRKTEKEQLAALKQKMVKLRDREARLKGRIAAKARKDDTRRKILLGAAIIQQAKENDSAKEWIIQALDDMPSRDRKLFMSWELLNFDDS